MHLDGGLIHRWRRSPDECGECGHTIAARCSDCGREMACGRLAVPCQVSGCFEGVLPEADMDLTSGPLEAPACAA